MPLAKRHCWDAACWIGPFILLWWLMPLWSGTALGNDYSRFAFEPHLELQIAWQAGQWPLYLPGYAGGQTASVLSLGQLHHPLPHLASAMPGFWDGGALSWMTFWRLLTLGAAHWVWWRLLRTLGWREDVAFAVTLAAIYHLRMLDCFRYGAGLESYTGMLFLGAAVAWQGLAPTRPVRALAVGAAAYWLATAGHLQLTFFGFGGAALFAALWPFVLRKVYPDTPLRVGQLWGRAFVAASFGVLAATWFLLPYYVEFVSENAGRVDSSYDWTLSFTDSVPGTFASFALPLRSDAHSAFGGTTLIAMPLALLLLPALRARWSWPVWVTAAAALGVLAYATGGATPVHRLAQATVPWLAYMRVPGRLLMVWPLLLLTAAILVRATPPIVITRGEREWRVPPLSALIAGSGAIALVAALLWLASDSAPSAFAPLAALFRNAPASLDWWLLPAGIAGALLLAIRVAAPDRGRWAGGAAIALFAVQLMGYCYWGTYIETAEPTPTYEQLQERRRTSWEYPGWVDARSHNRAVWRQAHEGVLETRLAWATTRVIPAATTEEAFLRSARERDAGSVVITNPPSTEPSLAPPRCDVSLTRSSFNHLVFELEMSGAGWLVTDLPCTGRWQAFSEGTPLPVRAANGLTTAVAVPAGASTVTLYYVSTSAITGVLVSSLAVLLGCALLLPSVESPPWRAGIAVALILGSVIAPVWWYGGLYDSDVGYRYRWSTPNPPAQLNLAFAKRVTLQPPLSHPGPDLHVASRAVDGTLAGPPAVTAESLWWDAPPSVTVDLAEVRPVGAVRVHMLDAPCRLQLSADGAVWRDAGSFKSDSLAPAELPLPAGSSARFVRLVALAPGKLSLTEIQILAP